MGGGGSEVCGFLDAKIPGNSCVSRRVRKRTLAPWKVWKRHWCSVRKLGPCLGVEILLDCGITNGIIHSGDCKNSIIVPMDSIICRTESRTKQFAFGIFPANERKPLLYFSGTSETETQRWMANLRHLLKPRKHKFMERTYNVSMVDNTHSRAAGLTGLHGDLVACRSGVFIKDIHSGHIIEILDWKEMNQFHLATAGRPDDVKRICVIHTTKEFRNGVGELHIFCLAAQKLLQDLVTQGRGPRVRKGAQRPLSLSEGDLRLSIHNDNSSDGNNGFPTLQNTVASSFVTAGLGLLISARSGSEAKLLHDLVENRRENEKNSSTIHGHSRAVDNVYQHEPANAFNIGSSLEELEEPSLLRRISGISVASGIYEEIKETPNIRTSFRLQSRIYESPKNLFFGSFPWNMEEPPPLPPRKRLGSGDTNNGSLSDDGFNFDLSTIMRSATPNAQDEITTTPDRINATQHFCESQQVPAIDNSDYVPMSPRNKDFAILENPSQEEIYMVMR